MMPNYGVYPQQTQRLNYLEQQMAQQNNMFLKGRPVTSIDEVKGALIDFDGRFNGYKKSINKKNGDTLLQVSPYFFLL